MKGLKSKASGDHNTSTSTAVNVFMYLSAVCRCIVQYVAPAVASIFNVFYHIYFLAILQRFPETAI